MLFDGKNLQFDSLNLFEGNTPWIEINGQKCLAEIKGAGNGLTLSFGDTGLVWTWQLQWNNGRLVVNARLVNGSGKSVKLGRLVWVDTEKFSWINSGKHILALETPYDGIDYYRQVKALDDAECWRKSAHFVELVERDSKEALQIGFLTFQKCLNYVIYNDRLQVVSDYDGWEMGAGVSIDCDVFTTVFSNNPMEQLEEWATLAADIIKPQFRHKPALGWLGWNWSKRELPDYKPGDFEADTLDNLEALQEKLGDYGMEFVWISISNILGGNPGNYLKWNYNNFPGGIEKLVNEMAKYNLKLGFWVGPYILSTHLTEMKEEFEDAFLRTKDGEILKYADIWSHGDAGKLPPEKRPGLYALDPSHPKVIAFLDKVFSTYYKQGVRYYMVDFIEAGTGRLLRHPYTEYHDRTQVIGPEVLLKGMQGIRKAAGPDTFILTSTGPQLTVAGTVDAVRTGNDFGEGRFIAPKSNFYPASFVINGSFTSAPRALGSGAIMYYTHNKLFLNDSGNVLSVDKPIPLESARIHATIHALSGASSMLGDDIRHIAPDRLDLIRKTLPRSIEIAKPLDLFEDNWPPRRFHRHIELGDDSFEVLALYNFSDSVIKESVPFSLLGLPENCSCNVWEFWTENFCGICERSLDVEIPAESVRVFRISRVLPRPQIVGTDMHILMGEMELSDISWDASKAELSFTANRPKGESGSVFIRLEQGTHVLNSGVCFTARNRDPYVGDIIVRVPFVFDGTPQKRVLYIPHYDDAEYTHVINP